MYALGAIVLVILGIVMILKPSLIFDITEGWKSSSNGTPSKLYLFNTRLGGVLCLLVGIFGLAASILQLF